MTKHEAIAEYRKLVYSYKLAWPFCIPDESILIPEINKHLTDEEKRKIFYE